jgi:signal transduction histidine kinase/ActR/RegA family two-component response regulator
MKKPPRTKLLIWFLIFSSLTFITTIGFNTFYFKKKASISTLMGEITELHVEILKTFVKLDDFITSETRNEAFFKSGYSSRLESFQASNDWIQQETKRLANLSREYKLGISENLLVIQQQMGEFDKLALQMVELIKSRGFKDNALAGFRGIIVNIEDRKLYIEELKREKRKAEESDRLKSAFLANMSHEIRTPMNAILGFSDLLGKLDAGSAKRVEFINQIQHSGNLLLNLIDDIIDIAKIEAGELAIKPGYTYVNKILDELLLSFRELVKKEGKGARLDIITSPGPRNNEFAILSDPFRLEQVLSNLIGNAIKFTEKGIVEFGYQIKNDNLVFHVKDTGIGLSSENRKLIFDRFRQVDDAHTRKYGGTGLGLAISKHLVELLGGMIWVESEPFKGTSFYFTIPNQVVSGGQSNVELSLDSHFGDFDWSNKHLVIAEDDDANAFFLMEALQSTGIKMNRVTNGHEAVELCQGESCPDIILMDIQMPVMDGLDATRLIKDRCPELPIIAQTAYAMVGQKEKCLQAGCNDYIAKPIKINELKSKIFIVTSPLKQVTIQGSLPRVPR